MKLMKSVILVLIASTGCSSLNFFDYRENTGLMAVKKPDGYGSARFGAELAVTSTGDADYMAVSAGRGETTIFYQLAEDGVLRDLDDVYQRYPTTTEDSGDRNASSRGSGAALAGLPVWTNGLGDNRKLVTGCIAVGEPDQANVVVDCQSVTSTYFDIHPGRGEPHSKHFGQRLAAVRPGPDGGQWLLVAAGDNALAVYSSPQEHSDPIDPTGPSERIVGLAAGRVHDDLVYVAAGLVNTSSGRYRIRVFAQASENAAEFKPIGCIGDDDAPGLGEYMTTGDLDGDGSDELIAGAAKITARSNKVHIFDVAAMIDENISEEGDTDSDEGDTDPGEEEADGLLYRVAVLAPKAVDGVSCDDECGFGTALAVGDIATDDDGPELVIGAYKAEAKGVEDAGAAYVYRGWERDGSGNSFDRVKLAGQVFDSTPSGGKAFGDSLAIAPMAGRNELLVGVTGGGKVFVAFCTGVGNNIEAGADITRDGDGKVVSTRCRL
jgi:hypothetical protein